VEVVSEAAVGLLELEHPDGSGELPVGVDVSGRPGGDHHRRLMLKPLEVRVPVGGVDLDEREMRAFDRVAAGTASLPVNEPPGRRVRRPLRIRGPRGALTRARERRRSARAEGGGRSVILAGRGRLVLSGVGALALLAAVAIISNGSAPLSPGRHEANVTRSSARFTALDRYGSHLAAPVVAAITEVARQRIIARRPHPRAPAHHTTRSRQPRPARLHAAVS